MVAKEVTEDILVAIRNNPNVITGEEGHSRISTSTVRKSEVIYQVKR